MRRSPTAARTTVQPSRGPRPRTRLRRGCDRRGGAAGGTVRRRGCPGGQATRWRGRPGIGARSRAAEAEAEACSRPDVPGDSCHRRGHPRTRQRPGRPARRHRHSRGRGVRLRQGHGQPRLPRRGQAGQADHAPTRTATATAASCATSTSATSTRVCGLIKNGLAIARYDSRDGYGYHQREPVYIAADKAKANIKCAPPAPAPAPAPQGSACAPGYSPCVPPYPPDVDCADVNGPIHGHRNGPARSRRRWRRGRLRVAAVEGLTRASRHDRSAA